MEKDGGGNEVETWAWFASPIEVQANTRNDASEDWGRLLVIQDPDGNRHDWAMPMSLLAGRGDEFRARLLSYGAQIAPSSYGRTAVGEYVQLWKPSRSARCVDRVGWHGNMFVLPDQTIGETAAERVILQTTGSAPQFDCTGTLAGWQEQVAVLALGNSRLIMAISTAFAGPLLYLLSEESGGFHYSGLSSIGKTTALHSAASVWGRPYDSWRMTDNGAEGMARGACDALLCLDEISQADARAVDAISYMIGNGSGKARMRRDATARPVIKWRVLFLSTGEKGLGDKLAEIGRRAQAGQGVRVVEIPSDAGAGFGLFEDLHGFDPDLLARHLRKASSDHKGCAGRAYLERLVGDLDSIKAMALEARSAWLDEQHLDDADGQVRRVAGRFALVAAAGELAAALDITPWPEGMASDAVTTCFNAWRERRGGAGPAEITEGIAQIRAFIEAHGHSRFEPVWAPSDRQERIINRAGFRKAEEGSWTYYVLTEIWRREVCKGFDAGALARAMREQGWLMPGEGKNMAIRTRVPGHGSMRLYGITGKFMASEGDE